MYNVLWRSGGRCAVRRTAAPRGRGLLPAGQGKANSWASVVGKLPQRGNSKPNNNSRTLLRSSTVVNYDVDRIDANIGGALLCRGPQRAARRKWPTLTDPSTPTYLVVEIIVVEILILSQPNGRTYTHIYK